MLDTVTEFLVPEVVAAATDEYLRAAGQRGHECFVLWSGAIDGESFRVESIHSPRQTAYRSGLGICVRVGAEELHRLNLWLYEHRQQVAAQIHSHPSDAFHSDTDDTYPIVTQRGGLSIVVPDFARFGIRGPGVAWFRLTSRGWRELEAETAARLVRFED